MLAIPQAGRGMLHRWPLLLTLAVVLAAVSGWGQAPDAPPTAETPTQPAEDATAEDATAEDATAEDATAEGATAEDAPAEASTDAAPQADTDAPAEADSPEEDSGQPAWLKSIDAFFGAYLVAPIASVLFFDFGTKQWLGTSIPFVVIWLFAGATFFTLRMNFINVRAFWHAIELTRGDYDDPSQEGEVSHFQALASALSATVGLGNIAGVAIAVGTGGPGATFWMILVGLLGMSSKFTECTLGQLYRTVDEEGVVLGGPMQYLREGLKEMQLAPLGVILSTLFAVICVGASFGGGNAFQVSQSLAAVQQEPALSFLQTYPWIYGIVMAVLAGSVIIGGIRSIGRVAGTIVPFMCGAYVLASLYILVANASEIPAAFQEIFDGAFSAKGVAGGVLGVMVVGIKRAVFSNEAGVGSAAIAHSAAKTDEPVSEGIVALLEPFIDTVVVCTMTALVIVITGVWKDPANAALVASDQGAALTSVAFQQGGFAWFRWILYAAVVLFAFSTLISWSYYGERCFVHLFGRRSSMTYKIIFVIFTVLGSIVTATNLMVFSDLMILGLAFPNVLGVLILSSKVRHELNGYWDRYQSGELKKHDQA